MKAEANWLHRLRPIESKKAEFEKSLNESTDYKWKEVLKLQRKLDKARREIDVA